MMRRTRRREEEEIQRAGSSMCSRHVLNGPDDIGRGQRLAVG
jgi:hypothetical protein